MQSPWLGAFAASIAAGVAFLIYWRTAAPDITWAHFGADGGDLLAAAVANGVPHPTGYPLYTMLLQLWLWAGSVLAPGASPARLGNLLSAALSAATVGLTVLLSGPLLRAHPAQWRLATAAGLLCAVTPLLWSQSLITEVYALHALLLAALATVVLRWPHRPLLFGLIVGLGLAHHRTFVLYLPAAAYLLWCEQKETAFSRRKWLLALGLAAILTGALYLRIPLAAGRDVPPPVNWGYADNWRGFWWLVSGAAYRAYFAGLDWSEAGLRAAAWARTIAVQFTPAGLVVAGIGLAAWDRTQPRLRTFALLWVLPVSAYAILYATRDAGVYLLPVVWLMALLIAAGAANAVGWVSRNSGLTARQASGSATVLLLAAVVAVTVVRAPQLTLRTDDEAVTWLHDVAAVIEPNSIVISSGDRTTFALWYGAWAAGDLLASAPGAVFVNDSLYQFDWYGRLLSQLYPSVPGVGESVSALLHQNAAGRPIYFAEPLDTVPAAHQEPAGVIWRYVP